MILNLAVAKALAKATLTVTVDASRAAGDPFKLPAPLLALVQADAAALGADDVEAMDSEGGRAGGSAAIRAAYDKIEAAVRAGYTGIGALLGNDILPTGISEADRLELYTTYGWEQGKLGRFTDARVLLLAELAIHGDETITNPAHRYNAALVDLIEAQLAIIDDEEPEVSGERQVAVSERRTSLELLETRLSRVRYHYCSASDELDRTPQLARIGCQPRRKRGPAAAPATPVTPPVNP